MLTCILAIGVYAYVLIGMIYGFIHTVHIYNSLKKLQVEEDYLRDMVRSYELTPSGAEYYARLQELYISQANSLEMLRSLNKAPKGYICQSFIISLVLWPYYIFSVVSENNKTKINKEDGR